LFANRFTALLDASVLADVTKRDLIFTLAHAEMYRFRWTEESLAEAGEQYRERLSELGKTAEEVELRSDTMRARLIGLFPEAMIVDKGREGPAHPGTDCTVTSAVYRAAILCRASVFVTDASQQYEASVFDSISVELKSGDAFIADAIDLDPVRAATAVKRLRTRYRKTPTSAEELLDIWEQKHGLVNAVALLRPYQDLI
jgi:hypothetical protein